MTDRWMLVSALDPRPPAVLWARLKVIFVPVMIVGTTVNRPPPYRPAVLLLIELRSMTNPLAPPAAYRPPPVSTAVLPDRVVRRSVSVPR